MALGWKDTRIRNSEFVANSFVHNFKFYDFNSI